MSETEEVGGEVAPDLRDYGRTLWRRRRLIIVIVVAAIAVGVFVSVIQTPVYNATAQLIIQRSDTLNSTPQNAQDAARNVDTETAVLRSQLVKDATKKTLGHEPSVRISSSQTGDVVNVIASSNDASRAAADANAYAKAYVALRRKQNTDDLVQAGQQVQARITAINARLPLLRAGSPELAAAQQQQTFLQQQLDQLQVSASLNQVGGASVLASANVNTSPVSPKPVRNVAIALVLGFLLAIGLAFLREHFDDTITTREDLERASNGLPVLGEIPRIAGGRHGDQSHLVAADAPNSAAAEGYRTLRTSVEFIAFDREFNSIQVTSSQTDDGKTATLANLALAFARSGTEVTIVCCDLRRPRIHEFFGLPNDVGFTSVLLGKTTALDALQRVNGEPNLSVMSAGPLPSNPSELLSSARAGDIISSFEKSSRPNLVLVDSPPVLVVGDSLIVSSMVDATLLVAGANSSSRRALRRSVQMLQQVNASLAGTVLHNAEVTERVESYGYAYFSPNSNGSNGRRSRGQRRKATRAKH